MSLNPNGRHSRFRFVKAYGVTFKLVLRYVILFILKRFVGAERFRPMASLAHEKTSREIVAALLELKGLYIKIGQTLSVMGNFLPQKFADGFESLQDAVPPHPYDEVRARFLKDFGKPPEEMFAHIEEAPLASASLGQVHIATSKTGEKLAVKVQYPDIEDITREDLKTIRNIFRLVNFLVPQYRLTTIYEECAKIILTELDYHNEAHNIEKIRVNFTADPRFIFPVVHKELSSAKVLTLGFIEGAKVTNLNALKEYGVDRTKLATDLIHFYCKQIFVDGVYHADPHPGNILILPDGKIAMIDFGAVAGVSEPMKKGLTLFVEGIIKRDARLMSQAIKMMGFVTKADADETLDKVVEYFYSKISGIRIENFKKLDVSQFHNLSDLVELRRMEISLKELTTLFVIPREWILLERTMLLLTGLSSQLDEHLNPIEIVVPYAETYLLGGEKKIAEILVGAAKELLLSYLNLPNSLDKTLKKLGAGEISVNFKGLKSELAPIRRGFAMLSTVILASVSGVLSYLFATQGQGAAAFRFELGFYGFGTLFLYYLLRR